MPPVLRSALQSFGTLLLGIHDRHGWHLLLTSLSLTSDCHHFYFSSWAKIPLQNPGSTSRSERDRWLKLMWSHGVCSAFIELYWSESREPIVIIVIVDNRPCLFGYFSRSSPPSCLWGEERVVNTSFIWLRFCLHPQVYSMNRCPLVCLRSTSSFLLQWPGARVEHELRPGRRVRPVARRVLWIHWQRVSTQTVTTETLSTSLPFVKAGFHQRHKHKHKHKNKGIKT